MDYDIYDHLDNDLAYKMTRTLLNNWFLHPQYGHLYTDGIRQHMRTIQAGYEYEELWASHKWMLCHILYLLRRYALEGHADRFLELPNIYRILTTMPKMEFVIQDKVTIQLLKHWIRASWEENLDGELSYVVEEEFIRKLFKALDQRHEEFLWEKKRRFKLFHEELIATVLHPERLERFATEAGMDFIDYTAVI